MSGKNKISKKVLWTRIVCAFLAFLMVASVAYLSVQLIVESVREAKAEKEAEAAKTTVVTTTKAPNTTKAPSTTKAPDTTTGAPNT